MQSRIIFTFLLSITSIFVFGQNTYHRLYETNLGRNTAIQEDTVFYHMNSSTTTGNVTAFGSVRFLEDNIKLVFTNHDNKGDIKWQREVDLGQDTVKILGVGEMTYNLNMDSILFTIDAEINSVAKQLYGKLDAAGGNLVLKTVNGNNFATLGATPQLAEFIDSTNILITQGDRPTISRIGGGNNLVWSRTYEIKNSNGDNIQNVITDVKMTADSTIYILGNQSDSNDFLVSELDSNGVQLWAESYQLSNLVGGGNLEAITPSELYPLENGNVAVVGEYITSGNTYGFAMLADTSGNVLFSKTFDANLGMTGEKNASLRNVIQAQDGSLWMSGVYTTLTDSIKYFVTNMDEAGNQNWTTVYGEQTSDDQVSTTSLLNDDVNGGASLVGHGFKNNIRVLSVMRHNESGSAMCSDTMMVRISDLGVSTDTLTTEVINGEIFFTDFAAEDEVFTNFTPPVLTIIDAFIFCPNEVIDTFLIADVGDVEVTSYQWRNEDGNIPGANNDTLFISMDGQYSVEVVINEDVCFIMCDTTEVTRLDVPMVSISIGDNTVCENGGVNVDALLRANPNGGRPPYNYSWDNGDSNQTRTVSETGTYRVTITDDCGETAVAEATLGLPDPSLSLVVFDSVCTNGTILLRAFYTQLDQNNAPVTIPGFDENIMYEWSTGETTETISATQSGDYSLTVTDNCGFTSTTSTSLEFDFDDCGSIRFPKIFFPSGQEDNERVFGPIPIPGDSLSVEALISNIEFKVFNRWGEEVFSEESEDNSAFYSTWDGTYNGDPAPSEVYIWYYRYSLNNVVQPTKKGDITLVR